MTLALSVLLILHAEPPQWDQWARGRDGQAFVANSAPEVRTRLRNFAFLNSGGVGGTGRQGWRADALKSLDGRDLVVLWPKNMGCEDIGQQVFETDGTTLTRLVDERVPQAWRVRHHVFDVAFAPAGRRAMIQDRLTLEQRSESRDALLLRLGTNYTVRWIKDGHGKDLAFRQAGGVVSFHPPAGKKVGVTLYYDGVVDDRGNAGLVSTTEATLTGGVWWPSTYREPATYDITVRAPKGWTTIAQGEPTAVKTTETETISTFAMELPTSVYSLSSGIFKSYSQTIDGKLFRVVANPRNDDPNFVLQNELNADVMRYFERIHPYPFKTWTSLVSSFYTDWALEAYSYASYPPDWLVTTEPHEISHTWWGGILPCSYLNSMWNEGFATISERLYLREGTQMPRDEARLAFRTDMSVLRGFDQLSIRQVSAEFGNAYSIAYEKSGSVLAMLEDELGPETFEKCLRAFCSARKPGELVEWEDFERAVKSVTKSDYQWFFRQWLDGKGVMTLSAKDARVADGRVEATLVSSKEYPRYRVECMVGYRDGTSELHKISVTESTWKVSLPASKPVAWLKFDPYHRLLRDYDFAERPRSLNHPALRGATQAAQEFLWMPLPTQKPEIREGVRGGVVALGYDPANPRFVDLAARVGAQILGNHLTWQGTTIDLSKGSLQAVVDVDGRWVLWVVGSVKVQPDACDGWLQICDELGRPKRAATLPSRTGKLSFSW